jgi:hypothetical protein
MEERRQSTESSIVAPEAETEGGRGANCFSLADKYAVCC